MFSSHDDSGGLYVHVNLPFTDLPRPHFRSLSTKTHVDRAKSPRRIPVESVGGFYAYKGRSHRCLPANILPHIFTIAPSLYFASLMTISTLIKLEEQPVPLFPESSTLPLSPSPLRSKTFVYDDSSFDDPFSHHGYFRQVPLARSIRGTERYRRHLDSIPDQSQPSTINLPQTYTLFVPPSIGSQSSDSTPIPSARQNHIPRPPNAFMLFRSDFLKRGIIPSHVESRQQNLSRIAGECWNLLSQEEKSKWQKEAANVLADHQKKNPTYKFTPAPRGSRRLAKTRGPRADPELGDGSDRIRQIREEYTQIAGPARAPPRRRRARKSVVLEQQNGVLSRAVHTPLPPSVPPSPSLPSPEPAYKDGPPLPPFFPQYSFPHVVPPRRPSTSLGFSTSPEGHSFAHASRSGFSLTRPTSAAASESELTDFLRDLDITPTAANFTNISMPKMTDASVSIAPSPSMSTTGFSFSDALRDAIPFSALNSELFPSPCSTAPSSSSSQSGEELEQDVFLNTLYSCVPFPYTIPTFDDTTYPLYDEQYFANAFADPAPATSCGDGIEASVPLLF